jgi:thiamine biosynthesis lipoprotein
VTVVGRDLADADAHATAALAMGRAGLAWLARLAGYQAAVVAEDGTWYRSGNLPEAVAAPGVDVLSVS